MADKFILKVTAGPTYDQKTQKDVLVNTSEPLHVSSDRIDADLRVRIRDFRGLPKGSPSSSPYFENPPHTSDRISIEFSFKLKDNITGEDLVFGNDFDHPIRDKLPWGFSTAFSFIKSWIDPGIFGDPYADEPYLYGPLLSSINVFRIGGKAEKAKATEDKCLSEGADEDGEEQRGSSGMPEDPSARKKYYLQKEHRDDFTFEEGRVYHCDFFNPYLDFNDFSLKLPVITIPVINHWDGQPLRYVLKKRDSDDPLFVILFSLTRIEQLEANAESDVVPEASDNTGGKKGDEEDDVD